MKRSQPSLPEITVLVQGIVRVPPWVCPSCSPRPADSMLQSGTLFTFWTQLTSPSLGPSVLPSPSLHFSLSLSLNFVLSQFLSLSLFFGFRLQTSLARSSTCSGLPKTPLAALRGRRHCSWMNAGSSLTHYGVTHTHTRTQWGEAHNNQFMFDTLCSPHCQDQSWGDRFNVCSTANVSASKKILRSALFKFIPCWASEQKLCVVSESSVCSSKSVQSAIIMILKGKSDILQQNALNGFPAELNEKIKPSCQCSKYKATDRRLLPSNTVTTIIWCFTGSLCQTISLAGNRGFLTFGQSHENRFPLFLVFMLISTEQVPTLATYSMYRHESVVNLPTLL